MPDHATPVKPRRKQVVLDYSFMEITDVGQLPRHQPEVEGKARMLIPLPPAPLEGEEGKDEDAAPPPLSPPTVRAEALRLSNNSLTSIAGLSGIMNTLLVNPCETIMWMDLSCNGLESVADEVLQFPNLMTLHAHGNQIASFKEIRKLAQLPQLRSLAMHGNPVEEKKHYRMYVLTMMPQISKMDFSMITQRDREQAKVWEATFRNRLEGRREDA